MSEEPKTAPPAADAKSAEKDSDRRQLDIVQKLLSQSPVTSDGRVTLGSGSSLAYTCSAAFLPVSAAGLEGAGADPRAAVFTVAYLAKHDGPTPRPLCFAFNGGPGSSSVWLHLGAMGPKRVRIHDDGTMPPPPYAVQDNPLTWLEHFDIVFIDPPQTGYSISASADARKQHLSVDGDVEALAEVVRVWLSRNRRFGSTLYLAGESYGTTRGAALADKLHELGVALRGVILVSCAMDLQTLEFTPRNDLPYALFLPAFANVAQFHGRLKGGAAASSKAARDAAESFVAEDYLAALHAGARLDDAERTRIAKRIAELTGLPVPLVEEKNLRISDATFFFEALRDEGRIVGRLEARVTGPMAASRTRDWEFDPGIESLVAPYTMAALDYYALLGVRTDQRYEILSVDTNKQWNWNRGEAKGNAFASTSPDLSRALRRNPHLKVFVASGRYDLGTPYSASDWSLAQLDAPASVLARVRHHYYDAGHMMYTREVDLKQLRDDLQAWLA